MGEDEPGDRADDVRRSSHLGPARRQAVRDEPDRLLHGLAALVEMGGAVEEDPQPAIEERGSEQESSGGHCGSFGRKGEGPVIAAPLTHRTRSRSAPVRSTDRQNRDVGPLTGDAGAFPVGRSISRDCQPSRRRPRCRRFRGIRRAPRSPRSRRSPSRPCPRRLFWSRRHRCIPPQANCFRIRRWSG